MFSREPNKLMYFMMRKGGSINVNGDAKIVTLSLKGSCGTVGKVHRLMAVKSWVRALR